MSSPIMTSTTHIYNTRASAKRKRLPNQEDEPQASKTQKTAQMKRREPSKATKRGQPERSERTWAESMKTRGPVDELDEKELPSRGRKPALRYYGWPFKYEYMLEYAKRHHLHFTVSKNARERFGGKEEFDFANLTDEHFRDSDLMEGIEYTAAYVAVRRLMKITGLHLDIDRPYSLDWDGIVYVWSNYDIDERWFLADGLGVYDEGVKVVEQAMNEDVHGAPSKLQWWYTFNNDVSPYESSRRWWTSYARNLGFQ